MRMLSLALIAPALFVHTPTVAAPPAASGAARPPACMRDSVTLIAAPAAATSIHPLGAEPPAQHIAAVLRSVNGCRKPIVIRSEVGTPRR